MPLISPFRAIFVAFTATWLLLAEHPVQAAPRAVELLKSAASSVASQLRAEALQFGHLAPLTEGDDDDQLGKKKKHKPFRTPMFNLFVQERASKGLPGPGQHLNFGALRPWPEILDYVNESPRRKLLLLIRHGQAISNWLEEVLGPDEWYTASQSCKYTTKEGETYEVFDAELRPYGEEQARQLNLLLGSAGWYQNLTAGVPARAIVSPLSRCLHTAQLALDGLPFLAVNVEEFCRETLGEDTCDARRSASDPEDKAWKKSGPGCKYEKGLNSSYPQFEYPVVGSKKVRPLGLISDRDTLWTKHDREKQKHQVKRARKFLSILWENAPEKIVFVVTHSGFTRSLLLAVGREPYRPQNAELVPVVVESVPK